MTGAKDDDQDEGEPAGGRRVFKNAHVRTWGPRYTSSVSSWEMVTLLSDFRRTSTVLISLGVK
jgi:hypothetical protein